jgi:hypothetical protein
MDTLQQIIVQVNSADEVRAAVQKGESLMNLTVSVVNYADLTTEEKATWDAFVAMINSK